MGSQPSPKIEQEARLAFDQVAHTQLTPEQFAALEERLVGDAAFRQAYVEQADLEAELEYQLRTTPPVAISSGSLAERRWPLTFAIALSLMLFSGLLSVLFIKPVRQIVFDSSMPAFTESQLSGSRPVAIVISRSEASQDDAQPLSVGDRLKPGILRLDRGQLQLEFASGVRVQMTGPAELHLISEIEASLVSGQTSVLTPPETKHFYLNGPVSAIANGSSEFIYRVQAKDVGSLDVYRGEVMASLLGENGDTLLNEQVTADHSAIFHGTSLDVKTAAFAESDRVSAMPIDDVSSYSTEDYAALIQQDKPLVYWRFEPGDLDGNLVRNHMSDRYAGELHLANDNSMAMNRGTLQFGPSPEQRYLKLNEPIPGFNQGEFTIEFWVRVERLHWGTFLGVLPIEQDDPTKETHLCLLEYANRTNLVHRPATIRMLYRYPAKTFHGGMNAFSPNSCVPGLWTHVVAVKTNNGTHLYVNNQHKVIFDELRFDDDSPYTVVVGQLDSARPLRQFEGQIDEIAIYNKALTPEQIKRHYEAMTGSPST
ncbi:LamG domain-containing protein [Bremerella cremea]|nr:LamG domain-containing protein [Bremerella cremea]